MAPKYFSSFFHAKTGVRYSEWIRALRVRHAMEMMRSANHSITRICYGVGFRNIRTFERAFKKHTSMTPREYKKVVSP